MNSQPIEDLMDHSTTVPREVVRICKILKEVDELTNKTNTELDKNRKLFLENKRWKSEKLEELKQKIDKDYKFILDLNDHKLEQLKELEFIINEHIDELNTSYSAYEKDFETIHKCKPNISKENIFLIYIFHLIFLIFYAFNAY